MLRDVQERLNRMGFDVGPADGHYGPRTEHGIMTALDRLEGKKTPIRVEKRVIPSDWMPWAPMRGIVWHWTAGTGKASKNDKKHYNILLQDDASLVLGDHPITAQVPPLRSGRYAAHTLNHNSYEIGLGMCGMLGATESPLQAGRHPLTPQQWAALPFALADLCRRYSIEPTRENVKSHAEVEQTLGIKQRGKWDTAWRPDTGQRGAIAIGDGVRAAVREILNGD